MVAQMPGVATVAQREGSLQVRVHPHGQRDGLGTALHARRLRRAGGQQPKPGKPASTRFRI